MDPGLPWPSEVTVAIERINLAWLAAYSLARTQMAPWTFLVAGALAFLFTVTGNENTLTKEILVLIGISFSTTLLAATTDSVTDSTAAN